MYFLPDQDLKIEWVHKDQSCPRDGHSLYGSRYCYFEIDRSECDAAMEDCRVYVLYAMTGETLINELARRKASELSTSTSDGVAEIDHLTSGDVKHRSEEMQFIGRFIMRSVDGGWDEHDGRGIKSTWTKLASMAPSWRFGFGRRRIDAGRGAIRLSEEGAEFPEAKGKPGVAQKAHG